MDGWRDGWMQRNATQPNASCVRACVHACICVSHVRARASDPMKVRPHVCLSTTSSHSLRAPPHLHRQDDNEEREKKQVDATERVAFSVFQVRRCRLCKRADGLLVVHEVLRTWANVRTHVRVSTHATQRRRPSTVILSTHAAAKTTLAELGVEEAANSNRGRTELN